LNAREAIAAIVDGRRLTEPQAAAVANSIMAGQASESQIAALLMGLRQRGETVDEITGFVRAMRACATSLPLNADEIVDTCGTGGDGCGTFNISTACAFVAAAAGCKVAKHGNRSNSSRSGSADVLEALGARIDLPPETSAQMINEIGIGFLFAPQYHAGARHAAIPRREIGVRTIFNTIGPLVHPAGARRQLMGIYDARLTEVAADVLKRLGSLHCMVVHGADGLDEITLTGPTRVSELKDGRVATFDITPEQLGVERRENLVGTAGGEPAENAEIIRAVLGGAGGPARDIVLLNAGAVVYVGGVAESLADGVLLAARAIDQGAAAAKLRAFVAASAEYGS
jgi:anthranilate phosphoribosyltransferase